MKIKENLFPLSLFAIYLGVLFRMSGIHTGLIVFMNKDGRLHICRDSTDASHCSLHCSGRSGILRMDPALFCLQEDSGKRDKKDYAADRREIR